ncbi:hypothetical protein POTOM_010587 [Populus tomentosa]|uniref:Uncharacterized protein n=1 Tax=Populus tomentosa TaxID=118781 RepID=A0A8X8AAB7_POPTO|nr:hypothetical protein POTOM_010587 [Populus tomentosa]
MWSAGVEALRRSISGRITVISTVPDSWSTEGEKRPKKKTGEIKDNAPPQPRKPGYLCSVSEGQAWRYFDVIGWLWCLVSRRKAQARRTSKEDNKQQVIRRLNPV